MNSFAYQARDKEGLAINGVVEAETEVAVVENLRHLGYSVVAIHKQGLTLKDVLARVKKFQSVPKRDIVFFARQLSALLKSGLPITSALSSIAQQIRNEKFRNAISDVLDRIQGGSSLSDALERHPKIFSDLFVNMVRVGETGGILDQVLERLVYLLSQEMDTSIRLRSALVYPLILVVAALGIVSFLMVNIIPKFVAIFETYDAKLPAATRILLGISVLFKNFWLIFIAAAVGFGFWLRRYLQTEDGQYKVHSFILRIPVVGDFYLKVIVARFARTLGALVRSGVPILRALAVTEKTVNNIVISRVIHNISNAVTEGQSLVEPFQASGIFPPMVIQMISAGEKSGRIDQMLTELAQYYDQETEYMVKNATTTLEPVLLLIMGGVVAFIALSVLLPIFNLIKVFRGGI